MSAWLWPNWGQGTAHAHLHHVQPSVTHTPVVAQPAVSPIMATLPQAQNVQLHHVSTNQQHITSQPVVHQTAHPWIGSAASAPHVPLRHVTPHVSHTPIVQQPHPILASSAASAPNVILNHVTPHVSHTPVMQQPHPFMASAASAPNVILNHVEPRVSHTPVGVTSSSAPATTSSAPLVSQVTSYVQQIPQYVQQTVQPYMHWPHLSGYHWPFQGPLLPPM